MKKLLFITLGSIVCAGCETLSPAERFIVENWETTIRVNTESEGDLIGLPYPYTVPSPSGIFQEMYYWDTYFTNAGLLLSGRIDQARDNASNMAYLINTYGFMLNGNRTWFLNNSQPPFFTRMVREIYAKTLDKGWLAQMYAAAKKEHEFWMMKRRAPGGLNRYTGFFKDDAARREIGAELAKRLKVKEPDDPKELASYGECYRSFGESGWDCSSRTDFRAHELVWSDLNALLYGMERDLAFFARELKTGEEKTWETAARKRRRLMNEMLWDDERGMFADYNFVSNTRSSFVSVAAFYALFTEVATPEQAARTRELLKILEQPYGLACSQKEGIFDRQWDYPHGWACLHFIAIQGLLNYGYVEDAVRLAEKYVSSIDRIYAETGALWEKYNVVTGKVSVTKEYETPQMLGWSAGVYLYCRDLLRKQ